MSLFGIIASSDRSVPNAPTIGTATDVGTSRPFNNGAATVTFTAPTYTGRLPITSYTVTSSPGGFTGTGASSPITVVGLQSSTSYTFTVTATNAVGTGPASAASNSITATTVPQAPTIGTATAGTGQATVTYTAGATGGKTPVTYTATSSPGGFTGTGASPITVTGLTNGTAYTFTVTAANANGSATSAASNSVTPTVPNFVIGSWSASTNFPNAQTQGGFSSIPSRGFAITGGVTSGGATGFSRIWTGSSWLNPANGGSIPNAYQGTFTRTSATEGQGGGGNNGSSNVSNTFYYDGTSWSVSTTLPSAISQLGSFSLGSNGIRVIYPSGGTSYYRSGTGSWSTGTSYPVTTFGEKNETGQDVNFTTGYVAASPDTTTVYSATSISGAWTLATAQPNPGYYTMSFTVPGKDARYIHNINQTGNTSTIYALNSAGTSYYSAGTSPSVSGWAGWAAGGYNSVMSLALGNVSGNFTQNHYTATVS